MYAKTVETSFSAKREYLMREVSSSCGCVCNLKFSSSVLERPSTSRQICRYTNKHQSQLPVRRGNLL